MATLLDALSQENLDNQREVVKNEKRQSYDNRPYGSFYEKLMAAVFPPGHPYHHTPIGSMEDLDAASLDDVTAFFRTWYAPNNAVLTIVGDVEEEAAFAAAERWFGPIPAKRCRPADSWRPDAGRTSGRPRARSCPTTCRWCASTSAGARVPFGTPAFDALEVATQILAGGQGSRLYRRLVRERADRAGRVAVHACRSSRDAAMLAGWVTVRPEADPADGGGGLPGRDGAASPASR